MPIDFVEDAIDFEPDAPTIDFQPDETPGAWEGAANALRRGVTGAQTIIPSILAAGSPSGQPSLFQRRRGFEEALSDPLYMSELMNAQDDPERMFQVEADRGPRARAEGLAARNKAIRDIWTGVTAEFAQEREAIPKSKAQQDLAQAKTTGDKWSVFLKYPVQTTSSIVLESLPPSIAGAVIGGATGGPAGMVAGVGLSSAAMEFSNEFLGEAQRQGFDPEDPAQLSRFLDSPGYDAAMDRALTRAGIVGGVDAATAGAAGRFIGPALKTGLKNVIVATGKEVGQQAVGGVVGEFGAQAATKQDRPFDWFDIAMEGVAEIATGPAEAYSNIRAKQKADRAAAVQRAAVSDNPRVAAIEAKLNATPPAVAPTITPSAISELEAAMRGNQVRPPRRPEPEPMPSAEPVIIREPEKPPTAIDFVPEKPVPPAEKAIPEAAPEPPPVQPEPAAQPEGGPRDLLDEIQAAVGKIAPREFYIVDPGFTLNKLEGGARMAARDILRGDGQSASDALTELQRRGIVGSDVKLAEFGRMLLKAAQDRIQARQQEAQAPVSPPSAVAETITGPTPSGNVQEGTGIPAESEPQGEGQPPLTSPAPTPQPQKDAVERALDALKIDMPPGFQAFGIVPDLWNRVVEIVRTAYRAGRSIAEAIEEGIRHLRENHTGRPINEAQVRQGLERILQPEARAEDRTQSLRERANALGEQMAAMEARGETVPPEMREQYRDLVNELGEEIRAGRQPVGVRVDADLELAEGTPEAAEAPRAAPRPGAARPVPSFTGAERLPRGNPLRILWTSLRNWRQRTGNWISRRAARMDITIGRDAGDNRAARLANQASLSVRLALNRAFGATGKDVRKKNALREAALTFAVEADGNQSTLQDFWEAISNSPAADTPAGQQAIRAIEFANTNWERMQPAVQLYQELTRIERETELNEGVNSHEWRGGYVFHRWKREQTTGADPTQARPAGTPFRNRRSVATYAEGIAAGREPVTLNGLELLAERVAAGQRRLNELRWVHGLRNMEDPVTHASVVVDVERVPRRPMGLPTPDRAEPTAEEANEPGVRPEWVSRVPEGYVLWRLGDLEVGVQESFAELMTKLTSASFFKNAPAKKVFGFIKSALLLFDTFHLGRMVAWRQMFGLFGGYRKGQTLLDFQTSDILEMARRGEIPREWTQGLIENKRRLELAVDTGFNIGNVLDNSWGDVLHHLPGIGTFNKWLFGQYQRGAMAEAWLIEFERMRRAMPNAPERAVARRVSRDLNNRFGNLGRQGLFKSRTAQDLARFIFLAPQWNEALIRSEIGAYGQTLRAPIESIQQRRLVAGTLMKATGLMAVGTFLANQILNFAFRGKPTWDNDEEGWDKKISAYIPDAVSGGPGFFLNPLALPMEYTHLIEGNLHRSGGDWAEAAKRIALSRTHSVARSALTLLTREDALGRKLREGEVLPAMAKALAPVPIAAPTAGAAAKQLITGQPSESYPGQYQKQLMASFGVKTDQAPNAEQRIRNLAREFNKAAGITPSAEFYTGDFSNLDKALRIGNMTDARSDMAELLKKKTPQQISDHYERTVRAPFTGQLARESQFFRSLTEEQRERYQEARAARRALAVKARELLREVVAVR